MTEAAIIGGGLFGCIIARSLQQQGFQVTIIDNAEPFAGSRPAACLMKPSWCTTIGKEAYSSSMQLLESLYEVKEIEFHTKVAKTKVRWIDPKVILSPAVNRFSEQIIRIHWSKDLQIWELYSSNGGSYTTKLCILAAGVWCNNILLASNLPLVPNLSPVTGTSFICAGKVEKPRILLWRPYKQAVFWEMYPKHIWIGDGETAKEYTEQHLMKSRNRCAEFLNRDPMHLSPTMGHRPYVKDAKPFYLEQHAPGLWVITGGAKNGTIAAGWAAGELSRRII
jgi:glycine/D-amino acid oxidase-like deaminating enzyme